MLRTKRKVVVSLHGIRTRGLWQKDLSPLLSEQGWIYYPLDYGWFSVLFFIPGVLRKRKVEWFRERYREIKNRYRDVIPSIIAHSFGTWIVCKAMFKYENLRFDKVILVGSIVPEKFDWETIYARNQVTAVRNDSGKKDIWARFSKFFAWGTGSSGFKGFSQKVPYLVERVYTDYDHSSAFGYDHYLGEWVPFLRRADEFCNGEVPSDSEDSVSPYDAARWSAITYFKQYISRLCAAFVRGEVYGDNGTATAQTNGRLVVLVPKTPGEASETATSRYYAANGFKRVSFGNRTRRTAQLGSDAALYDIPTTLHSLLCLDHRTDAELVDAVNEFVTTLRQRLDAAESEAKGIVEIRRI
jgi:hypothetical protein